MTARRHILQLCMASVLLMLSGCTEAIPEDVAQAYETLPETVDFNKHIRPILSDRCYACHGPDNNTREAELRLDIEENAFGKLKESGARAFVRGNHGKSEAWQRIVSEDAEIQMPPPESNLILTPREKAFLTKWIDEGAEWKAHWAFIPPEDPPLPVVDAMFASQVRNPIDQFVFAELALQGLEPSAEADKERLIRRVSLDLTGLPPSIEDIDQFLRDDTDDAYEKLVDRLLASTAYAERMTMEWLDVARYADSQGLHSDLKRFSWPWRDWVIKAFAQNMPYDDFITWQLAGDLLPDATREQKLATAFLRNHPTTAEGGAVNEEFRQQYVQDRTNTTATAFLGLTMECAACHDHKFDPVSQQEYYQMTAFFNNIKEVGMQAEINNEHGYASGPTMLMPDPDVEAQLASISDEIQKARQELSGIKNGVHLTDEEIQQLKHQSLNLPKPAGHYPFEIIESKALNVGNVHRIVQNTPVDKIVDGSFNALASGFPESVEGKVGQALRLEKERDLVFIKDIADFELNQPYSAGAWIYTEKQDANQTIIGNSGELGNAWRGWDLFLDTENRPTLRITSTYPHNYVQVTAQVKIGKETWRHIFFTYDGSGIADGIRLFVDGRQVELRTDYDRLYKSILHDWRPREGWDHKPIMVGRSGRFYTGENGVFKGTIDEVKVFHEALTALEVASIVATDDAELIDVAVLDDSIYSDHALIRNNSEYRKQMVALQQLLGKSVALIDDVPEVMVMEDMPDLRKTYVLERGQYDAPMVEVMPGTPAAVMQFADDLPRNRLGLARWLVDEKNPLTARVAVNRYWQMIFGEGLVRTPHDFGMQGALPSHPALLDWLAVRFVASGWDVKDLLKTIVMSATYRQSSGATDEHLEKDPDNIYLARGPSYRMPAELIRDNALTASGLLIDQVGGESVKPFQPEGLWVEKAGLVYTPNSGDSLYRRSMYTYVRRTTPHPAMTAFDAPNRSVCTIKRETTNTPLQALVLLNDPQFVEAARVLAQRVQLEGEAPVLEQIGFTFRLATGRRASSSELNLFNELYDKALARFTSRPQQADSLLSIGTHPFDQSLNKVQTAALTLVASTALNHDEAYMKR